MGLKRLVLVSLLGVMACKVFNTRETDGDFLTLTVEHDIQRIVDSAYVNLSWDEISVFEFRRWLIERKKEGDTLWVKAGEVAGRITNEFRDVIHDDEDILYRVGVEDLKGNIKWAEAFTEIPATTALFVPEERLNPSIAFKSPLIDDGDSILVGPGKYRDTLRILGKDVSVISRTGFRETVYRSRVEMNMGLLKGFTIYHAESDRHQNGGGIHAVGKAEIRNCLISDCSAGGKGGGAYLQNDASIYNSAFYKNRSNSLGRSVYITNSTGKVINNTFFIPIDTTKENVTVSALKNGFTFLNNIVFGGGTTFGMDSTSVYDKNIVIDYSRMDSVSISGGHIIMDDPKFIGSDTEPPVEFLLAPDSPCINAGHPDAQYNNIDGTRNTMGATGDPGGIME